MKPVPPPKKEPKGKKAAIQKTPAKKGTEKKPQEVEPPREESPEEKNENVIYCDNAREWCHIEYSLLPDFLPLIEINVVTWGEVAKIFTNEDCRTIKTVVINNVVWVYFEVHHKTNAFSNENLVKFKGSKITFTFSQDSKNMMPIVANDWPKQFTFCDFKDNSLSEKTMWFSELCQIDPPDDKYDTPSFKLDTYRMSRPDRILIVTLLNVKPLEKALQTRLYKVTDSLPIIDDPPNTTKKGKPGKKVTNKKDTKSNTKGKAGEIQEVTNQLFVNADLLIAGKYNACAERKEISETLRYASVFVNSSKILTDDQDVTYVPLIVNIQAFEALPLKKLQEHNIKKVIVRYEFENVLEKVETPHISLQENIALDDIQVFFLSSPEEQLAHETLMLRPSMIVLAESLLTRRFVMKIYGETEFVEEEVVPCLFGDRLTDPFISTPDHEMFLNYKPPSYSPEVFLGSSYVNLIQLIKGHDTIEATSVLTSSPLPPWDLTCDLDENTTDKEEKRALLSKLLTPGVIPDSIFLEYNSRIKLKVSTPCQLTVPKNQELLQLPEVSHRAILIFKDQCFNNEIINIIEKTNKGLIECVTGSIVSLTPSVQFVRTSSAPRISILSTRLSYCHNINQTLQELRRRDLHPNMTITGFFVEQEEESILVLEAMTYFILRLLEQIQLLFKSEDSVRIICDSSIFFTKRLYTDFSPQNIFRMKLPVSLDALLKEPKYYTQQSLLDESLQTLLMLDLLRRCRTINNACINQLFPSCKQLVSFFQVFGTQEGPLNSVNGSCVLATDLEETINN